MTQEEWLQKCAARFIKMTGMENNLAQYMAESQLESLKYDLTEDPERAADDEMSYWTAD